MTKLLISVTSIEEAQIALENGVDIIDLKDPYQGALGALPISSIMSIVKHVRRSPYPKPISTTIGDLPMNADVILEQIQLLATTEVDYIKIGFFQEGDYQTCLTALTKLTKSGVKLIAVLFAEYQYPDTIVDNIKQAGFVGLMLDTVHKDGQTVLYYHTTQYCVALAEKVRNAGIFFGLAGSLSLRDIESIKNIKPSYVGFRGGVCKDHSRKNDLDIEKIKTIRNALLVPEEFVV